MHHQHVGTGVPRIGDHRQSLSFDPDAISETLVASEARLLSVLRMVVGFLFIAHGLQKLFGFPVAAPGPPIPLGSLLGAAGVIETCGGLMMIAGLFTRVVAFVLSGEMAVAYFMQHALAGFWPIANGGELAALYCFTFFFLAAAGGGPWSLDALVGRRPDGDLEVR